MRPRLLLDPGERCVVEMQRLQQVHNLHACHNGRVLTFFSIKNRFKLRSLRSPYNFFVKSLSVRESVSILSCVFHIPHISVCEAPTSAFHTLWMIDCVGRPFWANGRYRQSKLSFNYPDQKAKFQSPNEDDCCK